MRRLKIKICGMRDESNIADVAMLKPDFMGFIFYRRSPRFCGNAGAGLLRGVPEGIAPVAVTVDMDSDAILALCAKYGFSTVQLHGRETPRQCLYLKRAGLHVWKALPVAGPADLQAAEAYDGCAEMLVLDTADPSRGGTGRKFNWEWLSSYGGSTPFLLSGGIAPGDAGAVLAVKHPLIAGVDLNSRFETSPAVKDASALRSFISMLNY